MSDTQKSQISGDHRLPRSLFITVVVLITISVTAALSRYLLPQHLYLPVARVLYTDFAEAQLPVEAAHPLSEALHRVGGALYMLLGAMQFMPRLRTRRPALHRWAGRAFIGVGLVALVSGVYMGIAFPYDNKEIAPTIVFACVMCFALLRAFLHIRRREVQAHREWMIRAYAVGLGIGTIRVLTVSARYSTGISVKILLGPMFWISWILTLVGAELWIHSVRRRQAEGSARVPG